MDDKQGAGGCCGGDCGSEAEGTGMPPMPDFSAIFGGGFPGMPMPGMTPEDLLGPDAKEKIKEVAEQIVTAFSEIDWPEVDNFSFNIGLVVKEAETDVDGIVIAPAKVINFGLEYH